MLKNDKDRRTCERYGARDETGHVHCTECPLNVSKYVWDFMCKANSHYDRHLKEWVPDEVEEE